MPAITIRILVAGMPSESTTAILSRLATHGWGARRVATLQQAREELESVAFDVALASETLQDGLGYELASGVARQGATLFVGVALSESALWLPVIERGTRVLGTPGIHPRVLLQEMESLLGERDREQEYGRTVSVAAAHSLGVPVRSHASGRAPATGQRPRRPQGV